MRTGVKSADQVRREFRRRGETISGWAVLHGVNPNLVFSVLAGRSKGFRGQAHKIAVLLGMKDGEIVT